MSYSKMMTELGAWPVITPAVFLGAGTTALRPTGVPVNSMYFDTDLGIPVWWSGTQWVNGTGAPA